MNKLLNLSKTIIIYSSILSASPAFASLAKAETPQFPSYPPFVALGCYEETTHLPVDVFSGALGFLGLYKNGTLAYESKQIDSVTGSFCSLELVPTMRNLGAGQRELRVDVRSLCRSNENQSSYRIRFPIDNPQVLKFSPAIDGFANIQCRAFQNDVSPSEYFPAPILNPKIDIDHGLSYDCKIPTGGLTTGDNGAYGVLVPLESSTSSELNYRTIKVNSLRAPGTAVCANPRLKLKNGEEILAIHFDDCHGNKSSDVEKPFPKNVRAIEMDSDDFECGIYRPNT